MLSDKKKKKTSVTRLSLEICFAAGNSIIPLKYGRRIGKKVYYHQLSFLRILAKFLRNFLEMLKSLFDFEGQALLINNNLQFTVCYDLSLQKFNSTDCVNTQIYYFYHESEMGMTPQRLDLSQPAGNYGYLACPLISNENLI